MDDTGRLLRKAARNLYRVVEDPEFWNPAFCLSFFQWCEVQAYESPDLVLVRSQLALELAGKTGDIHTRAKAHGVMASAYRRVPVLQRCEEEIRTALSLAQSCPCCLSEIYRRLGGIRIFQLRCPEAIRYLDKSIAQYEILGDSDGIGRSLISRGGALWKLGETDAALDDERKALKLLAPNTPEFFYLGALTNIAAFLATGEDRHFSEAEPFLNGLRTQLIGMQDVTAVRICLSWTHGLVLGRIGERKRALQMLRKARQRLLQRRQDAEVVAITADIANLYCDTSRYRYIADLVRDCLVRLGDVSGTKPLLGKVLQAAERELAETREILVELREAVSVSVPSLSRHPPLEAIAAP